ncbi:MAG: molecular chaperone [Chitinophagaceae bacterium]|jgi:P pilus assembly chaperone PapD|nr:molecular chaperone [Chitinophagaceae bacterium]
MNAAILKRKTKSTYSSVVFIAFIILFSTTAQAQGDLLMYPKRIVFEGTKKSQTLNLANSGKDTVRYLISVIQIRMKKDGSFENISQPDSGQLFADKYFRFFPRSVVLAPNEAQSVKIQLVNNSERQNGEYRSHIYFRAEPIKKPLGEAEIKKDSTSISVNLTAVFGISIPIIIRVGESHTGVTISEASFQLQNDSIPNLKASFNRTGNMSVYGDISVDHVSLQGKVTRIGIAKGMAIYTPNLVRDFDLILDKNAGVDYHKGKLHIVYTTQPDAKSVKIAELELRL